MNYVLTAGKTGPIHIAPVSVTVNGKSYQTNPVELNVIQPDTTDKLELEVALSQQQCFIGQPVVLAVLLVCFIGSLAVEGYSQAANLSGVIVSPEVVAYQGDGQNYPPSFKAPLNTGTEFDLIERRPGWLHIKLADGIDGWISQSAAEII
jgi:hypothetical protein